MAASITAPPRDSRPQTLKGRNPLRTTLAFRQDPLRFLLRLSQQCGDVSQWRLFTWPVYHVNHPDFVKHILQANHPNYNKDIILYKIGKPLLGEGLVTSDGDFWLRQRRLIQPAFHRQKVNGFAQLMTDATGAMLDEWEASGKTARAVDIAQEMMHLTLRIVAQALFSTDVSREAPAFSEAFNQSNSFLGKYLTMPFPPLQVPTPRNRRFHRDLKVLDEVVYQMIRERRQTKEDRGDLLSMLLGAVDEETAEGMTDLQLHDEVLTLLLAGNETTAMALAWCWYLLAQHPEVDERLYAELETTLAGRTPQLSDLPNLPYTQQVLEETMRLYPPAWFLMRKAINADTIGGYAIRANTFISYSAYTLHRHPEFWEDPERFDPERFTPERSARRPRFAYLPFGAGPRLCIGNGFAMLEGQLILATVAQRYRFRLVPGHAVTPEPALTLRTRDGVLVTMRQRGAGEEKRA
jgi:cytochrome P450